MRYKERRSKEISKHELNLNNNRLYKTTTIIKQSYLNLLEINLTHLYSASLSAASHCPTSPAAGPQLGHPLQTDPTGPEQSLSRANLTRCPNRLRTPSPARPIDHIAGTSG